MGPAKYDLMITSIVCVSLREGSSLQNISFRPLAEGKKEKKIDGFSLNIYTFLLFIFRFKNRKIFWEIALRKRGRIFPSWRRQWQPRSETKICHFNIDFLCLEKYFLPLGLVALLPLLELNLKRDFAASLREYIYIKKHKTISMLWSRWSDDVNNVIGRDYLTTSSDFWMFFLAEFCCSQRFGL